MIQFNFVVVVFLSCSYNRELEVIFNYLRRRSHFLSIS